jgi:putative methionine-R-sulfoxide reductase with GAF domain
VTPIHNASGLVRAVLDLDSPLEGRFTETDAAGLQKVCDALSQVIRWEVE